MRHEGAGADRPFQVAGLAEQTALGRAADALVALDITAAVVMVLAGDAVSPALDTLAD
jgi:hypothetical protein